MSQTYEQLVAGTTPWSQVYGKVNNMSEALRSAFSGTSFPTSPSPVAGQPCYRTDRLTSSGYPKKYIYTNNPLLGESGWVEVSEGSPIGEEVKTARGSKASLNERLLVLIDANGNLVVTGVSDGSITEQKLDIANAPVNLYIWRWNATLNKPEWVPSEVGGVDTFKVKNDGTDTEGYLGAKASELGLIKSYQHTQSSSNSFWTVNHNLNKSNIPIVRVFSETTEQYYTSGYCGEAGSYCGDGGYCGDGATANREVYEDIAYTKIKKTNQNSLEIHFAVSRTGKAVITI